MSLQNAKPSDRVGVLGAIDPQSATTAKSSGWVSAKLFQSFLITVMAGAFATNATLDAKLEQAQDSSGTSPKDVTGKAITQMTDAGSDDNKQALINLRADELDLDNGYTHFRVTVTPATAAVLIAAGVIGFDPRYAPASDNDAASVDEIVA